MYVVCGATGNTGKVVAENLRKAGKKVRALGRDPKKLAALVGLGAEAAVGDLTDAGFVAKALAGATAAYFLIPPHFTTKDLRAYQNLVTKNFAEAAKKHGLRHAVTLSSIGAHLTAKAGVVQGLYDMEQTLNTVPGLNVKHLRAGYFLENLLGQVGVVKQMGGLGSPLRGDIKIPMVATKDIAAVATRLLLELNFSGHSFHYVLGARDVSYNDAAAILGAAIGKPDMKYMQVAPAEARPAMIQGWGLSENMADAYLEFMAAVNRGDLLSDAKRSAESTTPTSLEDFAPLFARAYKA